MAHGVDSISPNFLRVHELEDLRTMSDETLQNWVTNMHNLSSLDKSIVRSIDVQDVLQHGFSFDPAKFRLCFLRRAHAVRQQSYNWP